MRISSLVPVRPLVRLGGRVFCVYYFASFQVVDALTRPVSYNTALPFAYILDREQVRLDWYSLFFVEILASILCMCRLLQPYRKEVLRGEYQHVWS